MSITTVPRIARPTREEFERYVRTQTPVVIENCFAGEPIAELSTRERVAERFGALPLLIREEFASAFMRMLNGQFPPGVPPYQKSTLAEYLGYVRLKPATKLMCIEQESPPEVLATFAPPAFVEGIGTEPAASKIFVGNAGNVAHMHFDGDHNHVLLYQVFGEKRVVLVPVDRTRHVRPLHNFAGVFLQNMEPAEQEAFLAEAGAHVAVVKPGDAVYMPMLIWHYCEYLEDSMSISVRFGRSKHNRFLYQRFHLNPFVQAIGARVGSDELDADAAQTMRVLAAAVERPFDSPTEKFRYLDGVLADEYRRLFGDDNPRERNIAFDAKLIELFGVDQIRRLDERTGARA
jgi:hypothetical protein